MKINVLGIDLSKTVFHLVGLDASGQVVVRKRCSRTQLLAFTANLQVRLIGMEACSGAHFLGRALRAQGHELALERIYAKILRPRHFPSPCPVVCLAIGAHLRLERSLPD